MVARLRAFPDKIQPLSMTDLQLNGVTPQPPLVRFIQPCPIQSDFTARTLPIRLDHAGDRKSDAPYGIDLDTEGSHRVVGLPSKYGMEG
jgi:hypothetical protein